MGEPLWRVYPIQLINVEHPQMAADPQTKLLWLRQVAFLLRKNTYVKMTTLVVVIGAANGNPLILFELSNDLL